EDGHRQPRPHAAHAGEHEEEGLLLGGEEPEEIQRILTHHRPDAKARRLPDLGHPGEREQRKKDAVSHAVHIDDGVAAPLLDDRAAQTRDHVPSPSLRWYAGDIRSARWLKARALRLLPRFCPAGFGGSPVMRLAMRACER